MTKKTSFLFFILLFSFCSTTDQQSESLQDETSNTVESKSDEVETSSEENTTTSTTTTTSSTTTTSTTTSTTTTTTTTTTTIPKKTYDSVEVNYLIAEDFSQEIVDVIKLYVDRAVDVYFQKDDNNWEYFNPIYIALIDENFENSIKITDEFQKILREENFAAFYPENLYYLTFDDCSLNGCSAVSSNFHVHGLHLVELGKPRPPEGMIVEDMANFVFHELFHIYQIAHIPDSNRESFAQKFGKRSGDHNNDVPWWSEGTATYLGAYLSIQYGDFYNNEIQYMHGSWLKDFMYWKIAGDAGSGKGSVQEQYLNNGIKLYNYEFGPDWYFGYHVGAWFVAYLINQTSEQAIYDFYDEVNELGFEDSFIKHFGKPYRDMIDEFDIFFDQPIENLLEIIPDV